MRRPVEAVRQRVALAERRRAKSRFTVPVHGAVRALMEQIRINKTAGQLHKYQLVSDVVQAVVVLLPAL